MGSRVKNKIEKLGALWGLVFVLVFFIAPTLVSAANSVSVMSGFSVVVGSLYGGYWITKNIIFKPKEEVEND